MWKAFVSFADRPFLYARVIFSLTRSTTKPGFFATWKRSITCWMPRSRWAQAAGYEALMTDQGTQRMTDRNAGERSTTLTATGLSPIVCWYRLAWRGIM